jgi:hypothetical protein
MAINSIMPLAAPPPPPPNAYRGLASRSAGAPIHPMHRPQSAYISFDVPDHPDNPPLKLTRGTSCVLCQQRKVRCDKNKPCANCVKAGVACNVVPPQRPRRRRKPHERDLVDRLRTYETLLAKNGIKFESIESDLRRIRRRGGGAGAGVSGGDDMDELDDDFQDLQTSPPPPRRGRR